MNRGFWEKLKEKKLAESKLSGQNEPIFVMAPMADVTDAPFRQIIAKYSRMGKPLGGPDALWTEFVSADGLFLGGYDKLIKDLAFTGAERPIIAQFFSSKPEMMEKAAYLASELGFDGVDINMGCPDKSIEKQGAGAGHIKNPPLAKEVIRAAVRGAERFADDMKEKGIEVKPLSISVKTRIGYNKNELATWVPALLEENIAVLTIHARTRKEMSKVPARWEHVREVVEMRDKLGSKTLIFGNGDALDLEDARKKAQESGADGVMLGRAIFGNPWLFDANRKVSAGAREIPLKEKLSVLVEHTYLFEKILGETKNFSVMKKHYKAYVNGFEGASELRAELMATNSAGEVEAIIKAYLTKQP